MEGMSRDLMDNGMDPGRDPKGQIQEGRMQKGWIQMGSSVGFYLGLDRSPVVSVWYRYHRYCSRYQNRYRSAMTPM